MSLLDRRRSPRFPFHSRCTLRIGTSDHLGTLMDISLTGALFIADVALELQIGQKCRPTVFFGGKSAYIALEGWIVRLHDHLIGIEFVDVSETLEQELYRLVDLNLSTVGLRNSDIPALLRKTN
jgi:c-di-GMP-binding flagellar brake protein YcgR